MNCPYFETLRCAQGDSDNTGACKDSCLPLRFQVA